MLLYTSINRHIFTFIITILVVIFLFNWDLYLYTLEADLAELLPSGRQTVFVNRIGWARTYLKKAGLFDSPARAMFTITEQGLDILHDNPNIIDNNYLMKLESFRGFQNVSYDTETSDERNNDIESGITPDDAFKESFRKI